jgi:hypothetical protein
MCPSKRAPPSLILSLLPSGTKRRATQNAAYVPRHISRQFFEAPGIKSFARIGGGLSKRGNRNAAIFVVGHCILCTVHRLFSLSLSCRLGDIGAHTSGMEAKGPGCFSGYAAAVAAAGSGAMPVRVGNAPEDHGSSLLNGSETLAQEIGVSVPKLDLVLGRSSVAQSNRLADHEGYGFRFGFADLFGGQGAAFAAMQHLVSLCCRNISPLMWRGNLCGARLGTGLKERDQARPSATQLDSWMCAGKSGCAKARFRCNSSNSTLPAAPTNRQSSDAEAPKGIPGRSSQLPDCYHSGVDVPSVNTSAVRA